MGLAGSPSLRDVRVRYYGHEPLQVTDTSGVPTEGVWPQQTTSGHRY